MGNRVKSVVAYARVSTDQQADSGLSIEAQREQLVSFTMASGLELVGLLHAGRGARSHPSCR